MKILSRLIAFLADFEKILAYSLSEIGTTMSCLQSFSLDLRWDMAEEVICWRGFRAADRPRYF
jgi:hypothetical protein